MAVAGTGDDRWPYAVAESTLAVTVAGLLVPLRVLAPGGTATDLSVLAAIFSLVGAPAALLAGEYADRTGNRRLVIVAGLAVGALALAGFPLLASAKLVILTNAILALGLAAVTPVAMMLVGEAAEREWNGRIARLSAVQRYGGTVGLVVGTAWIVGLTAVVAVDTGRRSLFVVGLGVVRPVASVGLVLVGGLLAVVGGSWAFLAVAGTAIVSRLTGKATRGAVPGTYAAVGAVASAAGNLLGSVLAGRGFGLAFGVAAAFVAASGVLVVVSRGLSSPAAGA